MQRKLLAEVPSRIEVVPHDRGLGGVKRKIGDGRIGANREGIDDHVNHGGDRGDGGDRRWPVGNHRAARPGHVAAKPRESLAHRGGAEHRPLPPSAMLRRYSKLAWTVSTSESRGA